MKMRSNSKPLVQHQKLIYRSATDRCTFIIKILMINNIKIKVLLEETIGDKENFIGEIILNNKDKIRQYEECKKKIKDGIKGMIEMVEQEKEESRITKEQGTLLTPEQDNDEINIRRMGLKQQPVITLIPEEEGLQEIGEDEMELSELEDGPRIRINKKEEKGKILTNYQKVLWELSTPTERTVEEGNEKDNIGNDLTKRYIRANRSSRRAMKEWYEYGRIFMGRMEEIKNGNKRKIKEQTARQKLYKEIKRNLIGETSLSAIKVNTQRALKIYDLFHRIGIEKINRIKLCSRDNLATLRTEEINKLVEYFKEKEGR